MARFGKRTLGIVAAAVVLGGTALGIALNGGTAHAQATGTISLTSVTIGGAGGSGYYPELTFSITCPVGYTAGVDSTVTQGSTFYGSTSSVACTGNPQTLTGADVITAPEQMGTEPKVIAPGQAFVGATMTLYPQQISPVPAPPASLAEFTTIG